MSFISAKFRGLVEKAEDGHIVVKPLGLVGDPAAVRVLSTDTWAKVWVAATLPDNNIILHLGPVQGDPSAVRVGALVYGIDPKTLKAECA